MIAMFFSLCFNTIILHAKTGLMKYLSLSEESLGCKMTICVQMSLHTCGWSDPSLSIMQTRLACNLVFLQDTVSKKEIWIWDCGVACDSLAAFRDWKWNLSLALGFEMITKAGLFALLFTGTKSFFCRNTGLKMKTCDVWKVTKDKREKKHEHLTWKWARKEIPLAPKYWRHWSNIFNSNLIKMYKIC